VLAFENWNVMVMFWPAETVEGDTTRFCISLSGPPIPQVGVAVNPVSVVLVAVAVKVEVAVQVEVAVNVFVYVGVDVRETTVKLVAVIVGVIVWFARGVFVHVTVLINVVVGLE
jgi:hypothetical protein